MEHLALTGLGQQPFKYSGTVEGLRTVFVVQGTPAEVARFFEHVAHSLSDPPVGDLNKEAGILRAEAAHRSVTPSSIALADRFGLKGWGLAGAEELGLVAPTAEMVHEWCRQWFTSGNAAIFASGSLPSDIDFELPAGSRLPVMDAEPLPFKTPAWTHSRVGGIGVSLVCRRAFQTTLLARVVRKRALDRLRFSEGISYDISASLERLDSAHSHLFIWADGLGDKLGSVRSMLQEVLDQLAEQGASPAELAAERESLQRSLEEPNFSIYELNLAATDELLGQPLPSGTDRVAELDRIRGDQVAEILREGLSSELLIVPESVSVLDARFAPVPYWSPDRVQGKEYRLRLPKNDTRFRFNLLVVAEDGLTRVFAPGQVVTIRFERCVAVKTWDDGSWTLFARDGLRLHVRPQDWQDGTVITQTLERKVPPGLRVAMGSRPMPDPESLIAGPSRKAVRSNVLFSFRRDVYWLVIFLIVSARLWFTIDPHPFTSGVNPTASLLAGVVWLVGAAITAAALYFLYWYYRIRRRLR